MKSKKSKECERQVSLHFIPCQRGNWLWNNDLADV